MLLSAGSAFAQETCTFSTSGDWTSATAFSGQADNCTGLSADDNIIIASDAVVTITTGSTVSQDGTTANTGVTVQSEGSLVMQPGSRIDLNVNGLDCQAGSTCTFEGGYRQFGVASPGVTTDIGATSVWYAGDLALSPGGDDTLFQFNYPLVKYDSAENDPFLTDSIAEVDATDVIMFYAPDVNDKNPPVDEGFFYEVSSVDTTGDYGMTFEVRQGARDTGYPLARRDILATTLSVAAKAGDRVLTLQAGDFPLSNYYNGRMVRFETSTSSGIPESMSYRIMESTENGTSADTIKIADANGIIAAKASGDVVWIDYGWKSADPFVVIQPVRINSATNAATLAAEKDSGIVLSGAYSLKAVVFGAVGSTVINEGSSSGVSQDVWWKDSTNDTSSTVRLLTTGSTSWKRVSMTGGATKFFVDPALPGAQAFTADPTAAKPVVCTDTGHPFATADKITISGSAMTQLNEERVFEVIRIDANSYSLKNEDGLGRVTGAGGTATKVLVEDRTHGFGPTDDNGAFTLDMYGARHLGDDVITLDDRRAQPVTASRVRCQFGSTNGDSMGCAENGKGGLRLPYGAANISVTNIEVLDSLAGGFAVGHQWAANNALVIGNSGPIGGSFQNGTGVSGPINNAYIVGNSISSANFNMIPSVGRNFLSRDNSNSDDGGSIIKRITDLNIQNGFVVNNSFNISGIDESAGFMENMAFIDNLTDHPNGRLFYIALNTQPSFEIRNVLISDNTDLLTYGVFVTNVDDPTVLTLDKIAIANMQKSNAVAWQDSLGGGAAQARATKNCLFNNTDNQTPSLMPADTLIGVPPAFISPQLNRYDVRKGSPWAEQGCGIKTAIPVGVCRMNRTLAWSNLQPECMADFNTGGVSSSQSFAPRAFGN